MSQKAGHHMNNLRLKISNTIAARIIEEVYPERTLLPREVDLCQEFSVGRSSIREALRTLTSCGLITPISGYGTQVNESKKWNLLDPQVLHWISSSSIKKTEFIGYLLDVRCLIEPHVNLLAVEHATNEDLQLLQDEIMTMSRSLNDIEKYTESDANFHCLIYQASGNPLWCSFSQFIFSALTDVLTISNTNTTLELLELAFSRHKKLYESIRDKDVSETKLLTKILLEQAVKELTEK